MPRTPSPKGFRLRRDVWRRRTAAAKVMTLQEKSRLLGIDDSMISRAENGQLVQSKFVLAAIEAFPEATLDELFERVYEDQSESAHSTTAAVA